MQRREDVEPRPDGEIVTFVGAEHAAGYHPSRPSRLGMTRNSSEIGVWADALWAVLNGMTEQIGRVRQDGLAGMSEGDPRSLRLVQLGMAFKKTDTGVLGDIFEWSVFKCFSDQDPALMDHLDLALRTAHPNVRLSDPRVVMVAHERGQFATAMSLAGSQATVPKAGPGRNPSLATVLSQATASNWKGDLLVGDVDGQWVPLTLKYRGRDLLNVTPDDPALLHAPRIGVTLKQFGVTSGIPTVRLNKHGLVIIELEARHGALRGFGSIFRLVEEGLERDFVTPADIATRHESDQEVLHYLERRRGNTIRDVLRELEDHLQVKPDPDPVTVDLTWEEFNSQTKAPAPEGGVIAVDGIKRARGWN